MRLYQLDQTSFSQAALARALRIKNDSYGACIPKGILGLFQKGSWDPKTASLPAGSLAIRENYRNPHGSLQ